MKSKKNYIQNKYNIKTYNGLNNKKRNTKNKINEGKVGQRKL